MRFMCTQVACQNQINVLTVFWLAKKFACDEYDFIGQSEMVFYRFFQRLVISVAVQKDRGLWERDWVLEFFFPSSSPLIIIINSPYFSTELSVQCDGAWAGAGCGGRSLW